MKKKIFVYVLTVFFLGLGVAVDAAKVKDPKISQDKFILKFKATDACVDCLLKKGELKDGKLKTVDALNKRHKVKMKKHLFFDEKRSPKERIKNAREKFKMRSQRNPKGQAPDLSNVYVMDVPQGSDIRHIIEEYANDPNVEYATPDYIMELISVPNDPLYSSLWAMPMINASTAWDFAQGDNTIVAILDTGIDYNHPDLAANVWSNPSEPINGLDDDNNGYVDDVRGWDFVNVDNDPFDGHYHGTHVAGTVAAVGNNSLGVIGVAPNAKLMALKGLSDTGSGSSYGLAEGIVYAAMNGADVINNSWGCSSACPSNPVIEDAVRTAHSMGVVVVFAAGNSNDDAVNYSPQNMTETVTVASSTSGDVRSSFSNYGSLIDVAAPGSSIYSTMPSNNYNYLSGTSMASPHVAGLAALILSQDPSLSNEAVRLSIRAGADDIHAPGFDIDSGHGRINALNSLQMQGGVEVAITSPLENELVDLAMSSLEVLGTAGGPGFESYTLEYKPESNVSWTAAEELVSTPVVNGTLGYIPLNGLNEGMHNIRVRVMGSDGFEYTEEVVVELANSGPEKIPGPDSLAIPKISGNKIAYYNITKQEIFIYDITTQTATPTGITGSGVQEFSLHGDNLAYLDSNTFTLYNYHLPTQQVTSLKYGSLDYPDIHGNKVVTGLYTSFDATRWDIHMYDILDGTEEILTSKTDNESWPKISQKYIIWRTGDNYDMEIYDRETGQVRVIPGRILDYRADGDRIVYSKYNYSTLVTDIYLYDMQTGTTSVIANSALDKDFPGISGNHVVWRGQVRNTEMGNIYHHDLSTGQTETLLTSDALVYSVRIDGNRIVWDQRDEPGGISSIYVHEFEISGSPPVLTPIGDKTVQEGQLLTFTVDATDPDGDELFFSAQSLPAGATFNSTTRQFDWTPDASQVGQHSGVFEVSDGDFRDSEMIIITVEASPESADTEPPTAVTNLALNYKTDTMVHFTWTPATDNVGIAGHNIYANGRLWKAPPGDNAGLINLEPDTEYTINVVAYDEAGNVGPDANPMLVVRTDPTDPPAMPDCGQVAPSVEITIPDTFGHAGRTRSHQFRVINNNPVECPEATFNLSAMMRTGWDVSFTSGDSIKLESGRSLLTYANISIPTTEQDGTYPYDLVATDATDSALRGMAQGNIRVYTDVTPPSITILSPQDGETLEKGRITISVDITDSSGIERVKYLVDGQYEYQDYKAPLNFDYTWNAGKLSSGLHTITVESWDNAVNKSSRTITVNLVDKTGGGGKGGNGGGGKGGGKGRK